MSDPFNFPVMSEVSVYLTNGKQFAKTEGVRIVGETVDKADLLKAVAGAIVFMEEAGEKDFRLPTPTEFASYIVGDLTGRRMHVAGPPAFTGFTEAELDAAIVEFRAEMAKAQADTEDDGDEDGRTD